MAENFIISTIYATESEPQDNILSSRESFLLKITGEKVCKDYYDNTGLITKELKINTIGNNETTVETKETLFFSTMENNALCGVLNFASFPEIEKTHSDVISDVVTEMHDDITSIKLCNVVSINSEIVSSNSCISYSKYQDTGLNIFESKKTAVDGKRTFNEYTFNSEEALGFLKY